jgi:hypothetical protein
MTMHLHHPALSLNGKRKGKIKFKSAEQKREHERLEQEWRELLKRQGAELETKRQSRAMKAPALTYKLSTPVGRSSGHDIASRDTGHSGAVATKAIPQYTGTSIVGISTLHKSNAVPVFSKQDAIDISKMRRG